MLREATRADDEALGQVMHDAVRNGRSLYTEAQRRAWAPAPRTGPAWSERLAGQTVILDEAGGEIGGFISLAPGGYIDFAYIRPARQGTGLFRALFGAVRERAEASGILQLRTRASLMARPAFAAMGFAVERRETVELGGEAFERFEMTMTLPPRSRRPVAPPQRGR